MAATTQVDAAVEAGEEETVVEEAAVETVAVEAATTTTRETSRAFLLSKEILRA